MKYNSNLRSKSSHKSTLVYCLRVSHTIHAATLPILYRNVIVSRLCTSRCFACQVQSVPLLGSYVRTMDLSRIRLNQLKHAANYPEISNPLLNTLALTPLITEFRAPSDTTSLIDDQVMDRLLNELPNLKVLDLNNCSSPAFAAAFTSTIQQLPRSNFLPFTSLEISNAFITPDVLHDLLPRLKYVKVLSLAETTVTVQALATLPNSVALRHLNVADCPLLQRAELVAFVLSHSHLQQSLVSLNASVSSHSGIASPDFGAMDTARFLRKAPKTIQHLRIGGWPMNSSCIDILRAKMADIKELEIGTGLRMVDLEKLFLDRPEQDSHLTADGDTAEQEDKSSPLIKTMRTAVAISKLRRRLKDVPPPKIPQTSLEYLDLRSMALEEQASIGESVILGEHSGALKAVEVSEEAFIGQEGEVLRRVVQSVGWKTKEGRRRIIFRAGPSQ